MMRQNAFDNRLWVCWHLQVLKHFVFQWLKAVVPADHWGDEGPIGEEEDYENYIWFKFVDLDNCIKYICKSYLGLRGGQHYVSVFAALCFCLKQHYVSVLADPPENLICSRLVPLTC